MAKHTTHKTGTAGKMRTIDHRRQRAVKHGAARVTASGRAR